MKHSAESLTRLPVMKGDLRLQKSPVGRLLPRQDRFARELAKDLVGVVDGKPARPIYQTYKDSGYTGHTYAASRLCRNVRIQKRVAEHVATMVDLTEIDEQWLITKAVALLEDADNESTQAAVLKLLMQWRAMLVQVKDDRTAQFSDHELAQGISRYNPEQPEAGGNKTLYYEILHELGGAVGPESGDTIN